MYANIYNDILDDYLVTRSRLHGNIYLGLPNYSNPIQILSLSLSFSLH